MARTKKRVLEDHRTTAQKSAAQKSAARMAASKFKAARILSTQELQDLPSQKHSDSDSDEDGSTYESFVQVCAACTLGSNAPFCFSHGCVWCARCMVRVS